MTNYLEKKLTKLMIKTLKEGYGADCPDYEEACSSCQAKKCIGFLEEHLSLLVFFEEQPFWYNWMKKYDRRGKDSS